MKVTQENIKSAFKDIKPYFKQGRRVTIIPAAQMSTGEVATTHSSYKIFKYDLKRVLKEQEFCILKIEIDKYQILNNIYQRIKQLKRDAIELIGEDTLWEQHADDLMYLFHQISLYI